MRDAMQRHARILTVTQREFVVSRMMRRPVPSSDSDVVIRGIRPVECISLSWHGPEVVLVVVVVTGGFLVLVR